MTDLRRASAAHIARELLKDPTKAAAVAALVGAKLKLEDLETPLSAALDRVRNDPAGAALRAFFGADSDR